jgi:hypothetical protein
MGGRVIHVDDVLKRTEEILVAKKKHIQSDQIQALAQAMVEAVNEELAARGER